MGFVIFVGGAVMAVVAGMCTYLIVLTEVRRHFPRAPRRAYAEALPGLGAPGGPPCTWRAIAAGGVS